MAAFRETDGTGGCPPTETPPAGYEIPFRFDDLGNLWINGCFDNFKFFGYARHDIASEVVLGTATAPVSVEADIVAGSGITAGTYTPLNITNNSACTIGILLAYDLTVDADVVGNSMAKFILSGRWNGAHVDSVACSSIRIIGETNYVRAIVGNAAAMHDPAIEAGGSAGMTLAPGAVGTVSARLFLEYAEGTPPGTVGTDRIVSAGSAVRAYGYCL